MVPGDQVVGVGTRRPGAVQPGQVQPRSRSARAVRCRVVKSRRVRPTSSGVAAGCRPGRARSRRRTASGRASRGRWGCRRRARPVGGGLHPTRGSGLGGGSLRALGRLLARARLTSAAGHTATRPQHLGCRLAGPGARRGQGLGGDADDDPHGAAVGGRDVVPGQGGLGEVLQGVVAALAGAAGVQGAVLGGLWGGPGVQRGFQRCSALLGEQALRRTSSPRRRWPSRTSAAGPGPSRRGRGGRRRIGSIVWRSSCTSRWKSRAREDRGVLDEQVLGLLHHLAPTRRRGGRRAGSVGVTCSTVSTTSFSCCARMSPASTARRVGASSGDRVDR